MLKFPWGAHITASRFPQKKKPEELLDFFRAIKNEPPLGISRPDFIGVGYSYFTLKPAKWDFKTYGGIRLGLSFKN